jgi:hypothetical protein
VCPGRAPARGRGRTQAGRRECNTPRAGRCRADTAASRGRTGHTPPIRRARRRSPRRAGTDAEERGTRFSFARVAAHGGLACPHWWGHPHWPDRVGQFIAALDNPADDHWGPGGKHRARLPAEPANVADRARLRQLLLSRPWEMSTGAAQWLADADIRYVRIS